MINKHGGCWFLKNKEACLATGFLFILTKTKLTTKKTNLCSIYIRCTYKYNQAQYENTAKIALYFFIHKLFN